MVTLENKKINLNDFSFWQVLSRVHRNEIISLLKRAYRISKQRKGGVINIYLRSDGMVMLLHNDSVPPSSLDYLEIERIDKPTNLKRYKSSIDFAETTYYNFVGNIFAESISQSLNYDHYVKGGFR